MVKTTREKIAVQLEEINQKVLAKEWRLKKYRQRVKQYKQNRTFQNNERKFYRQLEGHDTKTYQQPDAKETERIWTIIWQSKKHNEKAEWINNMTRKLVGLEEGPKGEINIEQLKKTLKKIPNWKTSGHDRIHGFWFEKFTSILRRTRKQLETKLSSRNLIKGINTWAVPLVRYSGHFLKWTETNLKKTNGPKN